MNSPRIRHLVQPSMSVVDRNLTITNEVRTIMTTAAIPTQTAHRGASQQGFELLISRLAVGMLRWSQQRAARRRPTHEEMTLLRRIERDTATATDLARLGRLN
jgi:hypothetical protein